MFMFMFMLLLLILILHGVWMLLDCSDEDEDEAFNWKVDEFIANIPYLTCPEPNPGRFMDVRALCDNLALGYVRSNMGLDYEFVEFASHLIPVFSTAHGDGLHFNFFARQKAAPYYSPPELFFVDVANGDPQTVIRCVPLLHQPYSLDDVNRPPKSHVFHPDNEYCVYCEHAKDGSLEKNFCLAPPLM
ncbi:uncharacterized protein LOC141606416 [Silene latifolia]|uniref:uncharacterized protein LOC141606416 n=1 Tax=Silene latifolia TaxID=37657 RepID=UPI003D7755B4